MTADLRTSARLQAGASSSQIPRLGLTSTTFLHGISLGLPALERELHRFSPTAVPWKPPARKRPWIVDISIIPGLNICPSAPKPDTKSRPDHHYSTFDTHDDPNRQNETSSYLSQSSRCYRQKLASQAHSCFLFFSLLACPPPPFFFAKFLLHELAHPLTRTAEHELVTMVIVHAMVVTAFGDSQERRDRSTIHFHFLDIGTTSRNK
ncbi:predicted protein [Histoplasma capsulatum G186AR]|uniref:Uncharacterized protein n=1 Tax=Ajellomyces capsulatus (strain G186AR / H82 / ATCC MYA-2454 / RMSCC 2432) TaxID=447093 RepID=C0NLK7_AJECG|nr:uncharacterized protein HCBG_04387 [Histoplasma capsulatum G186AR]EEH07508.1 predicted protein [Histoplasma capsulatum G186AR]